MFANQYLPKNAFFQEILIKYELAANRIYPGFEYNG